MVLDRPIPPAGRDRLGAEILAWQLPWRWAVAAVGALGGFGLHLLGLLPGAVPAAIPLRAGARPLVAAAVALVYVLGATLAARRAGRARQASGALRRATAVADLVLVYALVAVLGDPGWHDRALVLGIFSILTSQLYLGAGAALLAFRMAVPLYAALLAASHAGGVALDWPNEALSMGAFALGGWAVALVHASRQRRLDALVGLFARMEEGDFTRASDAATDPRPDGVSAVGRAYDRMRTQLATIVLTDPLTGCTNRRGFEQQLARELAQAERAGQPIALLALDIDHFKRVNDVAGHLAGDAVLRQVGALLRETARAGDVVARTGGEEFQLVLPDTDEEGATAFARRLVERVRATTFAEAPDGGRVTASVGVAALGLADPAAAEALKARADEALYAAKRSGRDRAVVWASRVGKRVTPRRGVARVGR